MRRKDIEAVKTLKREDAPIESTWNREAIYPTWKDWHAELETTLDRLPEISQFSGRLGSGANILLDWFETFNYFHGKVMKLYTFALTAISVDTNDNEAKSAYEQSINLYGKFNAATAVVKDELLEIGDQLFEWVDREPRLEAYRHYLQDLVRQKSHQRSAEVEELLSLVDIPFDGVYSTYIELTNTDLTFPDAIDSAGNSHRVSQSTVTPLGIQSADREHRRTAWENFSDSHLAMQNTLASIYSASVKQYVFLANARDYDSVLDLTLSPTNLPSEVFHNLINTFKDNLHVWHHYWEVKRKILKVDQLHPYDIWAPNVGNSPVIPYRQAVDWIAKAMSPLGDEYLSVLLRGSIEDRWVDYAPNIGKSQGAASSLSIDGKPPFIFMSYLDDLMSLSVLSHELGHSLHLYFADQNQPAIYNDYARFSSSIAETASSFNQTMTRDYLRKINDDNPQFQIALIDEAIFNFHRYFFIMPTLARFEWEVFNRAQQDEPINAEILNSILSDLFAEGYGETMQDDPERTAITWSQFSHLYLPFYTFQYSLGISAAHALADDVLSVKPGAAENYMRFLKAGSSQAPMDLWNLVGVDMTSPKPVEKAFAFLANMIDQLEEFVE
jgi:oligoendopeptidase F